jgi:hypothetical protein
MARRAGIEATGLDSDNLPALRRIHRVSAWEWVEHHRCEWGTLSRKAIKQKDLRFKRGQLLKLLGEIKKNGHLL